MNFRSFLIIIGCIAAFFITFSCSNDFIDPDLTEECLDEYTFAQDVSDILEKSCAYAGCHVSGGDGPGIYSKYGDVTGIIENEKFQTRVFLDGDMPPATEPESRLLTEDELHILKCWVENGYN